MNQQATGIEELLIYLESEVWEEGIPSYERKKIWQFHEVVTTTIITIMIFFIIVTLMNKFMEKKHHHNDQTKRESWEEGHIYSVACFIL